MKRFFILLFILFAPFWLQAEKLEKVSLQLQWLDQFQFAGYYVAKEKGFYKEAGLDVELLKFDNRVNPVEAVFGKKATYGIGRSSLIIDRSEGKGIVLLASIFQSSPSILLATKDSDIKTVKDFVGKRIMMTTDAATSVALQAMLNRNGVSIDDMTRVKHSFDINDLINKKTDLMASYISNEPFLLQEKGIEYTLFDPKDYGFDFYSDILFTSDDEIKNHQQRAMRFTEASLKGWKYAFSHIDETIELILDKYNVQNKSRVALTFEADALKKLAYANGEDLGHIGKEKIEKIYDFYNVMGLLENRIDFDKFVRHEHQDMVLPLLSKKERAYLKQHMTVTFTGDPNWLPFEAFDNSGNYIGIVADHLALIENSLGIKFNKIVSTTWSDALSIAMEGRASIISGDAADKILNQKFNPIDSYIQNPIVIVMKHTHDYVDNLKEIANKKIAVIKDYGYTADIYKNYPNIKFIEVENIQDALLGVETGQYDAMLASLSLASYTIAKMALDSIGIVGKTDMVMNVTLFVNKDKPLLHSIINKAIRNIDAVDHQNILAKWRHGSTIVKIDYTLVWQILALLGVVFIFMIYRFQMMSNYNKKLEKLSTTDALTELYNRRYLDTNMSAALELAKRYNTPFSLILMDIDDFKNINDTYGHDEGDRVLQKIATILSEHSRSNDIVGRWGGEEFLIICSHSNTEGALTVAEKMCRTIEEEVCFHDVCVTASFGVAEYDDDDTSDSIISKVDKALYRAKAEGKNRVIVAAK
ncbi:MAG: diguanylate cyclase [Campylobacterota bacterium]|nr:diguanylate cyclase [Campylobacterota bacterium]